MARAPARLGGLHLPGPPRLRGYPPPIPARLVITASLLGVACGNPSTSSDRVVRDSADVRIAVFAESEFGRFRSADVFGRPTASLGGDGNVELGRVLGGVLLERGGFAVADLMERRIVSVSASGAVRWRFGGEGDGPGEFREPTAFSWLPGDSVVLYDRRTARATVVGPDGELARIQTFDPERSGRRPESVWPIGYDHWLAWYTDISDARRVATDGQAVLEEFRHSLRIIRPDGPDEEVYSGFAGGMVKTGNMILFSPYGTSAHGATRTGTVALGVSDRFEVRLMHPLDPQEVGPLYIRSANGSGELRPEEVSRLRDSLDATARAVGAAESFYRPVFRQALLPDSRPAFSRILIGADGTIWVNRFAPFGAPSRVWLAFTHDGRFLGELELEAGTRMLDVGAKAALLARSDTYGVESVEAVPAGWPWQ